ncbi:hypothetical protein BOTBODRAFT_136350 [Botryobasidium botryosum FD-172 SS1]|uniref:B-related factor 1 n=1 Tax=Botryobasidium botryosum (strain FD-172 SS1) TaxID=930990 RepID=A0A067M5R4_BOTB1|nr:hypothetical protein BOTBODRAFT_136350 [Botryobasidium botryosum FD-172 SS1]
MPVRCPDCNCTDILHNAAAGNSCCANCGSVVEENVIVSEITFGETSSGAAMVQGSYVAQGSTRARMSGPYANQDGESREQVITNGRRRIVEVAIAMNLNTAVQDGAAQIFKLAVSINFIKGRTSRHVAAACLYAACRRLDENKMLIDFSDLLQLNVFELGATYLKLVRRLPLDVPLVDPSIYIKRFAALLEFGDETSKVAEDATRLLTRFRDDWMDTGRRPSGLCGACILLAARMNNFRRSVEEVVQVVKIADTTIKKRLEEFKKTPSGKLSIYDYKHVWLEEKMDPPALIRNREREKKAKEKRLRSEVEGEEGGEGEDSTAEAGEGQKKKRRTTPMKGQEASPAPEPGAVNATGNEAGELDLPPGPTATQESAVTESTLVNSQPATAGSSTESPNTPLETASPPSSPPVERAPLFHTDDDQDAVGSPEATGEEFTDPAMAAEMTSYLSTKQGTEVIKELDATKEPAPTAPADELKDLDEEELDAYLLDEEDVVKKTRMWVEFNKDYLEKLAAKEVDEQNGVVQRKKRKHKKARDAANPRGTTPAESAKTLLQKKKFSRRINYERLAGLFEDKRKGRQAAAASGGGAAGGAGDEDGGGDDENEAGDDDADIAMDVVVEEATNAFAFGRSQAGGEDEYYDNYEQDGFQEEV